MDTTPPPPPASSAGQPSGQPSGAPSGQPSGQYPGGTGPRPYTPPPPPSPSGADGFFDAVRRAGIVRSDERWIGGVAGGLALRLGVDPLVTRALFLLTSFLGGLGLVAYAVGWALLPEERDGRIHVQQLFRGHFDAALIAIGIVFFTGLSSPDRWLPWWGGWSGDRWWGGLFWLGAIALLVVVVATARRDDGTRTFPTAPAASGPTAPPPAPGHGADPAAPSAARPSGTPMDTTAPYPTASPADGAGPTHARTTDTPPTWAGPAAGAGGPSGPSGPYGPGSPYSGAPAPRPTPTPPSLPRPRVLGPGSTTISIVLGLGLLALAGFWYAQREGLYDGPVLLAAGSVLVVLAGLGIVVAGLRGRHSGGLGAIGVIAAIVLIPLAFFARADWTWSWDGTSSGVGDLRSTPTTVVEAERGYSVGAGEAVIDLTRVPLAGDVVDVPISVGAGDVTVVLPEGGAYTADIRVFAGEVFWLDERIQAGVGQRRGTYESPAVEAGATPEIVLDISVGAGKVVVEEE
ncbi:MAG: PspC domain-containing protein [Actinotalea sp.]|nr:PspC domain-containing protein [Actinotalea sp.]